MSFPQFPTGFLFGTASSAYQVEGAHDAEGRGLSIWDTYCRTPGRVAHGHLADPQLLQRLRGRA